MRALVIGWLVQIKPLIEIHRVSDIDRPRARVIEQNRVSLQDTSLECRITCTLRPFGEQLP
jgi:hypothetical protein